VWWFCWHYLYIASKKIRPIDIDRWVQFKSFGHAYLLYALLTTLSKRCQGVQSFRLQIYCFDVDNNDDDDEMSWRRSSVSWMCPVRAQRSISTACVAACTAARVYSLACHSLCRRQTKLKPFANSRVWVMGRIPWLWLPNPINKSIKIPHYTTSGYMCKGKEI